MNMYRLNCYDRRHALVGRDDFEAENIAEAKAIASMICDACSDAHYSYELWQGDLPIESGKTLDSVLRVGGLSARAKKLVLDHEIALWNSQWPVGKSRKLNLRVVDAWHTHLI